MSYFHDQEEELGLTYPAWGALLPSANPSTALTIFDEATEKGADRAARIFAASGKWPSMRPEVGAIVRLRLLWAAHYLSGLEYARCLGLVGTGVLPEKEKLMGMLLIQAWGEAGFASIAEMLEHLPPPNIGGGGLPARGGE